MSDDGNVNVVVIEALTMVNRLPSATGAMVMVTSCGPETQNPPVCQQTISAGEV